MSQVNDSTVRVVEAERAEVSAVYGLLDERLADARARLAQVLTAAPGSAGEVHERELAAHRWAAEARRLEGAADGLVFGRIDAGDGFALRIGRIGLHVEDADLPVLVDWRADAARPFYVATAVHPMGLRRRRHLRTADRTVVGVSDELLDGSSPTEEDVVGDSPLTEALQARRTGRMGAAVATLQAEQDAIVRSANRGVTVVQGGPGTGKTVVALHRAAYVLYAFPRAAERGVLVLGPNTRFLDYISQVLPSLGENDVVLATCADLAGIRPATADGPSGTDATDATDVARLKGGAELADALAELVRSRQAPEGGFTVRSGQEWVELTEQEVARSREVATRTGLGHNQARQVFKEQLVDAVTDALERGTEAVLDLIDAQVAELTGINLDRTAAADLRQLGLDGPPVVDATDVFDPDAVRGALLDDLGVERAVEELWPRLGAEDLVRELLDRPDVTARYLPRLTAEERGLLRRSPNAPWTAADVPLLDEAVCLLDGPPQRTYGHVVVDEAQEFTAMQWRMVARRCPARSMTLVGDFAQAGPATTARDWEEALTPQLGSRFTLNTLTVSYRTTEEILATTRELLARIAPGQQPSRSIRHGEAPRTVVTAPDTLAAAVLGEVNAQAREHPGDLVGVVCADDRVAELAAVLPGPVQLVPASQARGLEFDGVVVVDPTGITGAHPGGERDLYVALTRATKRLTTITAVAAGPTAAGTETAGVETAGAGSSGVAVSRD
ncbi:AAA family ATPase [Streptomyces sp. BE20]|uniref:HelD family protein n=1 Tax=Streptomyces sp. BE20 TaxID=3002525 RepID=UPI002E77CADC|nr:ATP-binding domain-containing protein [Streptomyces sp. BE20]MEE1821447.1 AAA family ATPase [Streptomyces sp. BE20]